MRRCCTTCMSPFRFFTTTRSATDRITHGSIRFSRTNGRSLAGTTLPDAELRHARRVHAWRLRHVEPRLPDVPGRDPQRHQPAVRDLWQRRRRHGKAHLSPEEYSRTWYRQNPPLSVVTWSQRDNNNYEESALLSTLSYFAQHTHHFLENYYMKSKRSVQKPMLKGPQHTCWRRTPRRRIDRCSC